MRVTKETKTRRPRLSNERDTIETESKATKKKPGLNDSSVHMYYISIFIGKPEKSLGSLLTDR